MIFTANIKLSKSISAFSLYVFSHVVAAKLVLELVSSNSDDGHQQPSSSSPKTVPLAGEASMKDETVITNISEGTVEKKKRLNIYLEISYWKICILI